MSPSPVVPDTPTVLLGRTFYFEPVVYACTYCMQYAYTDNSGVTRAMTCRRWRGICASPLGSVSVEVSSCNSISSSSSRSSFTLTPAKHHGQSQSVLKGRSCCTTRPLMLLNLTCPFGARTLQHVCLKSKVLVFFAAATGRFTCGPFPRPDRANPYSLDDLCFMAADTPEQRPLPTYSLHCCCCTRLLQ